MFLALHIPEVLVIFIVSLFVYLYDMHYNLVTVRLWSGFQLALYFGVRHLLEGGTY